MNTARKGRAKLKLPRKKPRKLVSKDGRSRSGRRKKAAS